MAIIIEEDPKVGLRNEHFDAKEPWDSLDENTQPEMRMTAVNLMEESSQDPIGVTGMNSFKMDESIIDCSEILSFSPTMSERSISLNLSLVNKENNFLSGIDDICQSELNTPEIPDLDGYVHNETLSWFENSDSVQNNCSTQTNVKTEQSNFNGNGSPCSPEILSQGLLKSIDECLPEHIIDYFLDKKVIAHKNNFTTDYPDLNTNSVDNMIQTSPLRHSNHDTFEHKENFKLEMDNKHNEHNFLTSQSEHLFKSLSTINFEDLREANIISKILYEENEVLDKKREEMMVNSFLNTEEYEDLTSPEQNIQSPVKVENNDSYITLNNESILKSFKEVYGEPAVLLNVKYMTTKKKIDLINNSLPQNVVFKKSPPKMEPIVVTIKDQNTYIKNDFLYNIAPTKCKTPEVVPSTSDTNSSILSPNVFPSTSAATIVAPPTASKTSKRKIRIPAKYEDDVSSDTFEDEITPQRTKKRGKYSLQGLSDAEKYQRIRQQNNVASKKCRDRKKRQQQGYQRELEKEESLSKQLKAKIHLLESRKQKWRDLCKSISCHVVY